MIIIGERFLSADHIEYIFVQEFSDGDCMVSVQMTGNTVKFIDNESDDEYDYLDKEMAFELRRRIVKAIADYKSSDKPEIQHVDFPTYKEVHPETEKEKS